MTAQILPMHAAHASEMGTIQGQYPQKMDSTAGATEPQTPVSPDTEESRGRRRDRDDSDGANNGDGASGGEVTGSSRKRRRSRKGLDKKFDCPHEGCGKSYSRAEHLYRHQLNHNPKQIYHCTFPDCHRSFVRQDLCARHKERHTARGSQLLRKDTFMHNLNPIVTAAMAPKNGSVNKQVDGKDSPAMPQAQSDRPFALPAPTANAQGQAVAGAHMSPPSMNSPASTMGRQDSLNRSNSDESYRGGPDAKAYDMQSQGSGNFAPPPRPYGSFSGPRPPLHNSPHPNTNASNNNGNFQRPELRAQTSNLSTYGSSSPYNSTPTPSQSYPPSATTPSYQSHSSTGFQSQQAFPPFSTLPPPEFPQATSGPPRRDQDNQYYNGTSGQTPMNGVESTSQIDSRINGVSEAMLENNASSYAIPMFGGEGYSRSPFAMADDFAAWLFNDSSTFGPGASPMGYAATPGGSQITGASSQIGLQAPYFNYDPSVAGYFSNPAPPAHPMAVNSILDTTLPESVLSEEKRKSLIYLIQERFNENDHAPVKRQKEDIFDGDTEADHHVLSLNMMQTYISSYWVHFHPQLPILHKPTFNATSCPDLLLLCIMCLGASCLEKSHGHEVTQKCSNLSNFLAWHLRWEMFMDADFRPPAKLWIFQALLLLEVFEKMYSTRPLHERAHIHHATTLTLMRRGSSLIGRSAMDSPPSVKDGKTNGAGVNTPDEWWNHWITNEATRRAAFGAFVMDSIHATMFGHSAVMVAHEMRLPLPCDEALWSATSSSEVGRVEATLHSNGIKQTTFLDGLKKTLNGQSVRTNSFGRTILMAGLLSVSWHMNQRDLQVSSLGVSQALGGRDKWRGSLTRAFDFWKQDFDSSLARPNELTAPNAYAYANGMDEENVFESRTVLHHLAHMAMHVDIVDCQIYAGANRLLGRSITPQDYNGAQRRMKEQWAPTARARDATFYALRFLSSVMIPDDYHMGQSGELPAAAFNYSARDDSLLNRPWVLYFATLIVWSYGYALDGPVKAPYQLPNHDAKVRDMVGYLRRVGGVRAPDDLAKIPDRNACLGMLILMRDMFKKTRWELLHEASNLLTKCVDMLVPGAGSSM